MAKIFEERLNMTSLVTEADENNDADQEQVVRLLEVEDNDDDAYQEKVDSSLDQEDKVDDDEKNGCCY